MCKPQSLCKNIYKLPFSKIKGPSLAANRWESYLVAWMWKRRERERMCFLFFVNMKTEKWCMCIYMREKMFFAATTTIYCIWKRYFLLIHVRQKKYYMLVTRGAISHLEINLGVPKFVNKFDQGRVSAKKRCDTRRRFLKEDAISIETEENRAGHRMRTARGL